MTEESFADLVRLADRWWKQGRQLDVQIMPHHERLQAELAALPIETRRVLVSLLILENLKELVHSPDTSAQVPRIHDCSVESGASDPTWGKKSDGDFALGVFLPIAACRRLHADLGVHLGETPSTGEKDPTP